MKWEMLHFIFSHQNNGVIVHHLLSHYHPVEPERVHPHPLDVCEQDISEFEQLFVPPLYQDALPKGDLAGGLHSLVDELIHPWLVGASNRPSALWK